MTSIDHLAMAKEDLAIAESDDAKREAYKRAAEHIAAHIEETGDSKAAVATAIGQGRTQIRRLLDWRESGYAAATPYLADTKATTRAAKSHAKSVIRDPEQRSELIESLEPEERTELLQDLWAKSREEAETDWKPDPDKTRKREKQEMDDEARKHTDLAWDHLRARTSLFADVNVSDWEKQQLEWCRKAADRLLGNTELDDELKEILNAVE